MNQGQKGEIFQRIQRGLPGAFLWRAKAVDRGYQEELLSENSVFHVAGGSIYVKPASGPARYLSHEDIIGSELMYLLISRDKNAVPSIHFVLECGDLCLCHEEVEAAAIHIVAADEKDRVKPMVLSFLLWMEEDGQMRGSFLGGSQRRLLDHTWGLQRLLAQGGGEFRDGVFMGSVGVPAAPSA